MALINKDGEGLAPVTETTDRVSISKDLVRSITNLTRPSKSLKQDDNVHLCLYNM